MAREVVDVLRVSTTAEADSSVLSARTDALLPSFNKLLAKYSLPTVSFLQAITSPLFIVLYECLLETRLPIAIPQRRSIDHAMRIKNIKLLIGTIAHDVLGMDLSYLDPRGVVERDGPALMDMVEVFLGIGRLMAGKQGEDQAEITEASQGSDNFVDATEDNEPQSSPSYSHYSVPMSSASPSAASGSSVGSSPHDLLSFRAKGVFERMKPTLSSLETAPHDTDSSEPEPRPEPILSKRLQMLFSDMASTTPTRPKTHPVKQNLTQKAHSPAARTRSIVAAHYTPIIQARRRVSRQLHERGAPVSFSRIGSPVRVLPTPRKRPRSRKLLQVSPPTSRSDWLKSTASGPYHHSASISGDDSVWEDENPAHRRTVLSDDTERTPRANRRRSPVRMAFGDARSASVTSESTTFSIPSYYNRSSPSSVDASSPSVMPAGNDSGRGSEASIEWSERSSPVLQRPRSRRSVSQEVMSSTQNIYVPVHAVNFRVDSPYTAALRRRREKAIHALRREREHARLQPGKASRQRSHEDGDWLQDSETSNTTAEEEELHAAIERLRLRGIKEVERQRWLLRELGLR
ncbi:hypothetical protein SAICODRAFT_29543 [Saitoella complicata NRRL Y-17804]|uniref:DUF5745 domain-containing protein n=1 Tax=Saitoella complicata (strain BCRC 22490 / CBS 7301 / JCM 7358 / NBRC 10748 / NRRL Y-17804) TaxID=698492 RepID=A0A0E9N7L4_SAICN|nr:uncharacterized protein SAICODRAFT_29543 [Saitoella complicata NRRL Y-17804]ODQ54433.1 hypothetical protein SAICODRAFT_29543 [Saitoella complicata NRRL Y-17804]GAO45892.1 hypothetical protein G7K_0138-t1 [Saitoella complicata NRRL Y-17804]